MTILVPVSRSMLKPHATKNSIPPFLNKKIVRISVDLTKALFFLLFFFFLHPLPPLQPSLFDTVMKLDMSLNVYSPHDAPCMKSSRSNSEPWGREFFIVKQSPMLPPNPCLILMMPYSSPNTPTNIVRVCFQFFIVINYVKTEMTNTCFCVMRILDVEREYPIHIT